ncbi:peptidoglycan-binding domain-containing protein [Streptomyces sp. NPDC048002]|uniref:peptidoglycan-binding domain-containing protein n=1 Tax=unclassified Streptomyces TaxID=2593676 RepID=UPI0033C1A124
MENDGPPLEPARVLRPRRTDALADLFREPDEPHGRSDGYESVAPPAPESGAEDDTQELPVVPAAPPGRPHSGPAVSRVVIAAAVTVAALAGFGGALLVPRDGAEGRGGAAAPAPPAAASPAPDGSAAPDPEAPGILREGDSGPQVAELQRRLLSVPDVYVPGSTSGRYDTTLTEAVARFQLWYGVRGDEDGVYGDDTRLALESRTAAGG